MTKRRVLFVYSSMVIGGSTTSLLGVLAGLDLDAMDVDLLLLESPGPLAGSIPPGVTVIAPPVASTHLRRRLLSPRYSLAWVRAWFAGVIAGAPLVRSQMLARPFVDRYPGPAREYDVAVAFLELVPIAFVAHRVSAGRKIGWLHADYKGSGLRGGVESQSFQQFHSLVFVSSATRSTFLELYPEVAGRAIVVPNPLDVASIRRRSEEPVGAPLLPDPATCGLNLVSNSRIDFSSKGLDRAAQAFRRLLDDHPQAKVHWWVIGDGPDRRALADLIADLGLTQTVTMLGSLVNPFPVLSRMDIMFIPSVYEGKPMAVGEAQALGLPVLATRYASADEQVADGFDGLVVDNSLEGVVGGLTALVRDPGLLATLRAGARSRRDSVDGTPALVDALLTGSPTPLVEGNQ